MLPEVQSLLILQERDLRLAQLRQALANAPKERVMFEGEIDAARAELDAKKKALRENELERKKLELEAAQLGERILKFRAQQQQTRKNDEYAAFNNEITHCERAISGLDDNQLTLMEAADKLRTEIVELEKTFAEREKELRAKITEVEQRILNLTTREQETAAERAATATPINPELLSRYERILAKKTPAVAPLKAAVCAGCHMKVSSARVSDARAENEVAYCDQCGRIIYFVE